MAQQLPKDLQDLGAQPIDDHLKELGFEPNQPEIEPQRPQMNFAVVNKQEIPVESSGIKGFIARHADELAQQKSGILNPNPEQNPLMFKSWLPDTEASPGVLGAIRHYGYQHIVQPAISTMGILGSAMGANPPEEPIGLEGLKSHINEVSPEATPQQLELPKPQEVASTPEPQIPATVQSTPSLLSQVPSLQPNEAINKLQNILDQPNLKAATTNWKNELAQSRAEKFGQVENLTSSGEQRFNDKLAAMKGTLEKPNFAVPKLEQADVDSLHDFIEKTTLTSPEKLRAGVALNKVLSGQIPQDNEIDLLSQVFGSPFAKSLLNRRSLGAKTSNLISDLVNLPKSMVTAGHFSAPFRQGIMLIHRPEFWQSFVDMFRAAGSENTFQQIQQGIRELPHYDLMEETHLPLTHLGNDLSMREEAIISRLAERIPIYGKLVVRPGNRAYTAFLNTVRANTFSSLIDDLSNAAKALPANEKMIADPLTNKELAQELANYVGAASGRGSLGSAEKYSGLLNTLLFSPRLQAARYQIIKMAISPSTSNVVRKEALKSLMALTTAGSTILGLAKFGGAEVSGNPTSADFGKAKIGNTRIDPWAGYQQYAVLASRLMSGQTTSSVSGKTTSYGMKYGSPTEKDALESFAMNKANPIISFAYNMLNAKTIHGQSTFQPSKELTNMMMPILVQNVIDIYKDDPKLLPLAIPNAVGIGVQNYGSR